MIRIFRLLIYLVCLAVFTSPLYGQQQNKETGRLLLIEQNGKFGYIDKTGKIVISPQFDGASGSFSEDLACVKKTASGVI